MNYDDRNDPLCCCEYFDRNNERNHLLGCCCNCVDFDQVFDSFICCRSINPSQKRKMFLTFQDRLRIPWRGGAKIISLDAVAPIILLPVFLLIAAIRIECSIFILIAIPFLLAYIKFNLIPVLPRTKFFFLWSISSALYLLALFQTTLPLYIFLPEENLIFVLLFLGSMFSFYKVRVIWYQQKRTLESTTTDHENDDAIILITSDGDQYDERTSINRRSNPMIGHHEQNFNHWLDACVCLANRKMFMIGCVLSVCALIFYAILTLTAICHPFVVGNFLGILLVLPDDCSDVFDLYDVSIGFVGAVYSLMMALFIIFQFFKQLILISKERTISGNRLYP